MSMMTSLGGPHGSDNIGEKGVILLITLWGLIEETVEKGIHGCYGEERQGCGRGEGNPG